MVPDFRCKKSKLIMQIIKSIAIICVSASFGCITASSLETPNGSDVVPFIGVMLGAFGASVLLYCLLERLER